MATVEQLYKDFGVLADAKDKAGEHEAAYLSILSAVKGAPNEKRLASQFIARFFKHFPGLAEVALNAQFDLCEDDDVNIRKQAMKDLPSLCRGAPEHVPRVANILTQLLQSDSPTELCLIHMGLMSLLQINAKATLQGLFSQILLDDIVDVVRERAIRFMSTKMSSLPAETWTKDVEEFLIEESRKVLQDVTGDEFVLFMRILSNLSSLQTLQGRQMLLDIVCEQSDLDAPFEASDRDNIERLLQCGREAMHLFSKNLHSTKFVVYICEQVLPTLSDFVDAVTVENDSVTPDLRLDMLRLLAEMAPFCGELPQPKKQANAAFQCLLKYMPMPPAELNGSGEPAVSSEPQLQFSYVECLLYAFHQLARQCPEILTDDSAAETLKNFRVRLQYFARGVQGYIKQLKMALQGKSGDDLKTDENKVKMVALRITNNINILIKDLFRSPPSYKANVTLSWKPVTPKSAPVAKDTTNAGTKRPGITPITFDSSSSAPTKKVMKGDQKVYTPPGGKFSERAGSYQGYDGSQRGFRGGRGGRSRGRGAWRKW